MSYDAEETGDGRPVELYLFQIGGTAYRVTNANRDIVIGAFTYESLALMRTNPLLSKDKNAGRLELTCPESFAVMQQFITILPSQQPTLTIFRTHLSDVSEEVVAFWKGKVSSVAFADGIAKAVCSYIASEFQKQMPRFTYQGVCNHVLYDEGCLVTDTDFDYTGTVDSIVEGITIKIVGLRTAVDSLPNVGGLSSGEKDLYWQGGMVTANSEFRMVLEGNVGGDADTIRVLLAFQELAASDVIQAFAGCAHSLDICDRKFDNVVRFGGFPYIPTINPYEINLASGT